MLCLWGIGDRVGNPVSRRLFPAQILHLHSRILRNDTHVRAGNNGKTRIEALVSAVKVELKLQN